MKVNLYLVKSFLRQALYPSGSPAASVQAAITTLTNIQAGFYSEAIEDEQTVIQTSVEGKTFQFQISPGLSKAAIMAICEECIGRIELMVDANEQLDEADRLDDATLIQRLRGKYLRPRQPATRTDFRNLQH